MQPKGLAIRKRTQIASANRTMFLWVAGVSVVFGAAVVAAMFLTQMLLFNERVLNEKNQTISTLQADNGNIDELTNQINKLSTDSALASSRAKPDDKATQVILDALPSDANSLALGASLQTKLLAGIPGLELVSIQVDPVAGIESLSNDPAVENASPDLTVAQNQITFNFSVKGNATNLKQVLLNLERSIRTIDIISLKIESQNDGSVVLTVQGRAFYEPERVVQLKDKVVK